MAFDIWVFINWSQKSREEKIYCKPPVRSWKDWGWLPVLGTLHILCALLSSFTERTHFMKRSGSNCGVVPRPAHKSPFCSCVQIWNLSFETRQFVMLTAVAGTTLRSGTPTCAPWPVDTGNATGKLESHQGCSSHNCVLHPSQDSGLFQSFP